MLKSLYITLISNYKTTDKLIILWLIIFISLRNSFSDQYSFSVSFNQFKEEGSTFAMSCFIFAFFRAGSPTEPHYLDCCYVYVLH